MAARTFGTMIDVVIEKNLLWWRWHVPDIHRYGNSLTKKRARKAAAEAIKEYKGARGLYADPKWERWSASDVERYAHGS